MNILIKIIAAVWLTFSFTPLLQAQTDSLLKFDGIDVSLNYYQDIIKKDAKTGSRYFSREENDIYGISSVVMKNDILQIQSTNRTLKIENINSIHINTGRNHAVSTSIGLGLGFLGGAFAGLAYGLNVNEKNAPTVGLGIFVGMILLGGVTGYLAAPMSYEEVSLKYYNTNEKKNIMIKSFNKSKMQDF
jgi:hypothetical protein